MSPIKVAVLGFWHVHARDYAQQAIDHPDVELVAVWDDDGDRGRAGAVQFGAEYVAGLDRLLESDVDGVIVTTATSAHRDVMLAAARAGKHIFTEKLLATTVADSEAIVAAADAAGVTLTVSLPRLYHGYTRTIKDIADAGSLGQVAYGRVRLSHDGAVTRPGDAAWLPERFFDPADAVGGALTDLGCHPIYLTQLFLGAHPETVSATYRSLTRRSLEDHAVVTLGYRDQRIGVAEAGFVSRAPFAIELAGTEGWLSYRGRDDVVRLGGRAFGDRVQTVAVQPDEPDAFSRWVGHVKRGARVDGNDRNGNDDKDDNVARAVELTRLVVAANRAASTGTTISYGG